MKGLFTLLSFCFTLSLFGQGYEIKVNINDYAEKQLVLAYYQGDKQFVKDTVESTPDGSFLFKGDEPLDDGMYLVVLLPDSKIVQFLIDGNDQSFEMTCFANDPSATVEVSGNQPTEDFYAYMNFLGGQRPRATEINERIKAANEIADEAALKAARADLANINVEVKAYQDKILNANPTSLLSVFLKANLQIDVPDFSGAENPDYERYIYTKHHWFDNVEMTDPRLLKTPVQFEKVDFFVEKLTPQHPDSINLAIDQVLEMVKPAKETFQNYLIYFLNKYAASKVIGQDAVYVHIAEKYYKTGIAHWTEEEQLGKIMESVDRLKPILLGKIAPDIKIMEIDIEGTIKKKDNENEHDRFAKVRDLNLHEIDAPYVVLFIWDPDCGHCKKSMPEMIAFHDKWSPKGVQMVALCTEVYKDMPKCAEMIKEKGMLKFLNVMDPYIQSKYKTLYDVRTTPQIFVLDKDKEIVMKRLDAKQLDEVFEDLMLNDEELKKRL